MVINIMLFNLFAIAEQFIIDAMILYIDTKTHPGTFSVANLGYTMTVILAHHSDEHRKSDVFFVFGKKK